MNDFQISWCRFVPQHLDSTSTKEHKHSIFELHIIIHGSVAIYFSNNNYITLHEKEYIILPSQTLHKFVFCSENVYKFTIGFSANSKDVREQLAFLNNPFYTAPCTPDISHLIEIMNQKQAQPSLFAHKYIMLMCQCLIYDCINPFLSQMPHPFYNRINSHNQRIEQINQIITENISKPIGVDDIAQILCISSQHLNRLFQKTYGIPVHVYIQQQKISYAQHLLTSSTLSLGDIAESMGYSSVYSFSRFFKNATNVSPAKYRRENTIP